MSERSCSRWGDVRNGSFRHARICEHPAFLLMRGGWVYILANRYRGTIYIGVTADIRARIWQHKTQPEGFVARYEVQELVHIEEYPTIEEAIAREKALKKWHREWKIELIERENRDWNDLFDTINA